jgi:hypothetical protein
MKNKKNLWILPVALLAVFGLIMTGCPEALVESEITEFTFDLIDQLGEDGQYVMELSDNGEWGIQWTTTDDGNTFFPVFQGRKITKGGGYFVTLTGTSSAAAAQGLNITLVDQLQDSGWWKELSNSKINFLSSIPAGAFTVTAEILATDTAADGTPRANTIAIASSATTPITFTLTEFKIGRR